MSEEHISRYRTLLSQHEIWLGEIAVKIEIRVYRDNQTGRFQALPSHDIQVPEIQRSPYADIAPRPDGPDYVLGKLISSLNSYYNLGVSSGAAPSASWLVPNENPWS
jgi:hypothetical protein